MYILHLGMLLIYKQMGCYEFSIGASFGWNIYGLFRNIFPIKFIN